MLISFYCIVKSREAALFPSLEAARRAARAAVSRDMPIDKKTTNTSYKWRTDFGTGRQLLKCLSIVHPPWVACLRRNDFDTEAAASHEFIGYF